MNFFEKSDGWIVHSIIGKSTVKAIINAGDHYNHAIFNYEELNEGLNRLITNGYVVRSGKLFRLSEKAKKMTPKKFGLFRLTGSIDHMFF